MDLTVEVNAFRELLTSSNNITILLPETATADAVAGALALYLSLTQLTKNVTVGLAKPVTVGWSHLIGINKITTQLGNKNFVISLDYTEGAIEKVSYNIAGAKFNLVIEPRSGAPVFDAKNVSYSHSGMMTDLVITIGAPTLQSLGKFYSENQTTFDEKPIIVVDHLTTNSQYGKVNFVRPGASICEIVALMIQATQLPVDSDIATNLFDGIATASRNFTTSTVTSDTFAAASWVLAQGARRKQSLPIRQEELPQKEVIGSSSTEAPQTPPDWLKPKIYKGSQLL